MPFVISMTPSKGVPGVTAISKNGGYDSRLIIRVAGLIIWLYAGLFALTMVAWMSGYAGH